MNKHITALLCAAGLLAGAFGPSRPARADCPAIFGDVTADGQANVVDVQCEILATLYELAGAEGAPPECLVAGMVVADMNCDGGVNVTDVQHTISASLDVALDPSLDANANGCPDSCEGGLVDDCEGAPDGTACDDADACTAADSCSGGVCVGVAVECDDANPCTDDGCAPSLGCAYLNNAAPCDDGDLCTEGDVCSGGTCMSGAPVDCDDGDLCTSGDACVDGQCVGTPVACDDGNPCTDDGCAPTLGCVTFPNDNPCDDGNPCTLDDACEDGVCVAGTSMDCDDGEPCTDDGCIAELGCVSLPIAGPCNDQDPCTVGDICQSGECVGTPMDCDDDNVCTTDGCMPPVGCIHIDSDGPCDDGDPCTTADVCQDGACLGTLVDCDDGDACTVDICDGDCAYVAVDCSDGDPCTADTCDPELGCANTPVEPCGPCACSDGVPLEDEACGESVNAGCNSDPMTYTPLAGGVPVCGLAWADGGSRDVDFYRLDVSDFGGPGLQTVVAELESEFPGTLLILEPPLVPGCDEVFPVGDANSELGCGIPAVVEVELTPGTYYVFVSPSDFQGAPCGTDNAYTLSVTCPDNPDLVCTVPCTSEADCDDGDVCTTDGCDLDGSCTHTPIPNCPNQSTCCSANSGLACDDVLCLACVCLADPFCCLLGWTESCADIAKGGSCGDQCPCGGGGPPPPVTDSCCDAHAQPGCSAQACANCVCGYDSYCCATAWDEDCAQCAAGIGGVAACTEAGACDVPCSCAGFVAGDGSCCLDNGSPGCDDLGCQECVCDLDAFCCETTWDALCAECGDGTGGVEACQLGGWCTFDCQCP